MPTHFKGWAIPGPVPPGAGRAVEVPVDETVDAISGHYRIFQFRAGHRFSTDDVLTAWYGTTWAPSARQVLDLGPASGRSRRLPPGGCRAATFVTVEAQPESVRLARKSAEYNGLLDRIAIRHGDFRDHALLGEDERFDLGSAAPRTSRSAPGSKATTHRRWHAASTFAATSGTTAALRPGTLYPVACSRACSRNSSASARLRPPSTRAC